MKKLSDMDQDEFRDLFVNRYVTHSDLANFATKDELKKVAQDASDHSTKIIRSAIFDAIKLEMPETVKGVLISVGIDASDPVKMQDTMSALRSIGKNKVEDTKTIRGYAIKATGNLITMLISFGLLLWASRALKFLK